MASASASGRSTHRAFRVFVVLARSLMRRLILS